MIPLQWSTVISSNLDAIKYDPGTAELGVRYRNGREYVFEGVPPEEAEALYHASSPGGYFRNNIMGAYSERRV